MLPFAVFCTPGRSGNLHLPAPAVLNNRKTCNKSPRAEKEFVKHGYGVN